MKKFKVVIPYKENNKKEGQEYIIDFQVIAKDKVTARKKGLKKFENFLEYNLASWIRVPINEKIKVEFIEEIKEPDPWSYL